MTLKPLEEAPFETYLQILREQGYEEDADLSEAFYVELLTGLEVENRVLTREDIMKTPFKNLVESAEKLLNGVQEQVKEYSVPTSVTMNGPVLRGEGADKLGEQELQFLLARQLQLHESEKMRLSAGR